MKKIIIGNWKMNPVQKEEAEKIFQGIFLRINKFEEKKYSLPKVIIAPPFVYLDFFSRVIKKKKIKQIRLFSQNVFWQEKGSFTGEISPLMLKNLSVSGSIVGHSERRNFFGETNQMVNKKAKRLVENNLMAVVCIGETEKDKKKKVAFRVLKKQLDESLKGIKKNKLNYLMVAYEPVWAIGGKYACPPKEAVNSINFIKNELGKIFGKREGGKIKVLYGGSINRENAELYAKEKEIDGVLVGRASLSPSGFTKIIQLFSE